MIFAGRHIDFQMLAITQGATRNMLCNPKIRAFLSGIPASGPEFAAVRCILLGNGWLARRCLKVMKLPEIKRKRSSETDDAVRATQRMLVHFL